MKRKEMVFNQIGVVIVKQPESLRDLLRSYGIPTTTDAKAEEFIRKIIYAIDNRGTAFHIDLAKLIAPTTRKTPPIHLGDLASQDNFLQVDQQEDAYVGLIVGAISGIANKVGSIKSKKRRRAEASQEMLAGIMKAKAYQAQQLQMARQVAAQEYQKAQSIARSTAQNAVQKKAQERQLKWLGAIGAIGLTMVVMWLIHQNYENTKD